LLGNFRNIFYREIKKLERLGYTVHRIQTVIPNPNWSTDNGVDFLKRLVKGIDNGQVIVMGFHGAGSKDGVTGEPNWPDGSNAAGDLYPFGCVEEQYAGKGGSFERTVLATDQEFMDLFKIPPAVGTKDSPLFWKKGFGCYDQPIQKFGPRKKFVGWGVKLSLLKMGEKAIVTGFPCHWQADAIGGVHALYRNPPDLSSSVWARWDLKQFVDYMLGVGPHSDTLIGTNANTHWTKYPPDLHVPYNLNVSNIMDLSEGKPCEHLNRPEECRKWLFWSTKETWNAEGNTITVEIPTTWESELVLSDAHLFPYIFVLDLQRNPNQSSFQFSDRSRNSLPLSSKQIIRTSLSVRHHRPRIMKDTISD